MAETVTSLFGGHIYYAQNYAPAAYLREVLPSLPTDAAPIRSVSDTRMRPLDRLLEIMVRLRDPERGCPWDREQNFSTIAPYTIEEAYEVADAIARDDMAALKDELGDLLFQVVFHARMAEEQGFFGFEDVAAAIADKMERRHPHVLATCKSIRQRRKTGPGRNTKLPSVGIAPKPTARGKASSME